MDGKRIKVTLDIKPEMAILLGMILHGGTYGIKAASKLLTAKSIKDMHDIGSSIIEQVSEQEYLDTYEQELIAKLSVEEQAFYKELKNASKLR
ncbi:MAG: hypothetical protein RR293_01700 [Bacteroidales bacterium]